MPGLQNKMPGIARSADLSQMTQLTNTEQHRSSNFKGWTGCISGMQSLRNMCSSRKPKSIQSSASESQSIQQPLSVQPTNSVELDETQEPTHFVKGPQTVDEWLRSIPAIRSLLGEKSSIIQEVLVEKIP